MRYAILILVALTSGCGVTAVDAARYGLEGTSRVSAAIDTDLAAQRREVSAAIIANPEATRADHEEAMEPYDEALAVSEDLRDAHLATERALDATEAGQEENWRALIGCVVSGLSRLASIGARRIQLPDEIGSVISTLTPLAEGQCPIPPRTPETP